VELGIDNWELATGNWKLTKHTHTWPHYRNC
jgi:hypothetical protein